MKEQRYVASIADIKYLSDMPEEYMPYVHFQAAREGRKLKGTERVAVLNVSTTTSYIAVFLDNGKTIKDVEREVKESAAVLNTDSKNILKDLLEGRT